MPGKIGHKEQILYDTSIIIGFLRGNKSCKSIVEKVRDGKKVGFVSTITVFELYLGAFLSPNPATSIQDVKEILSWFQPPLAFNEIAAQKAANIYSKLRETNELIGLSDIFIAATALTTGLIIETLNRTHFLRIPHIKLK